MQTLIHYSIQKIDELFVEFNRVQEMYYSKSFEFDTCLEHFCIALLDYFKQKGDNAKESEILKTMNMLSATKKGFDPVNLVKINSGKRELLSGLSYHALENIHRILQEIYQKERKKLDDGEEILSNLIITLYQNGILDDVKIAEFNSIATIELYWVQLISKNTSIAGIYKKLRLQLADEDIYLLLEKILLRIA